jgi:5-methylcytosine-specific restriction protein A
MPRAKRLCSHPGCLAAAGVNGRCARHPHARYSEPWQRTGAGYGKRLPDRLHAAARALSGGLCVVCGAPGDEVDHIIPRHLGGGDDIDNLRLLCAACHAAKTAREGHAALAERRRQAAAGAAGKERQ